MIKEFQNLKKQLVQSLKELHQHKQLLQEKTTQFDVEKIEMFKELVNALSVLDKQIALAKKLPNNNERSNKLLLEIYEMHHRDLEEILINAGVIIHLHNPLDTFLSSESLSKGNSANSLAQKRYMYQNIPLN